MVHWQPPEQALKKVKELVSDPIVSRYGNDEGIPELREALRKKVNGIISSYNLHSVLVGIWKVKLSV